MKHPIVPIAVSLALALATASQAGDKKPGPVEARPGRPALEPGRSYVLILPDGTCRACPYKAKALTVSPDGWAEFQFEKDAPPRLWHLMPEKAGAPVPPFWVNMQTIVGYTLAPLETEVKPDVRPEDKAQAPEAQPSPTPKER